ncbi:hypothetical protein CPB83DRAFT_889603 [Crepidotus variabilis]|uniref:Uncharacterized protein n=1 Tax=Crepidotus variabilis TaxID=179855 RepID=A0A9P6ERG5_9AGAR|nr:hypothetical protein CPB83DRAFT_889603 [Crepidotus variabilis]
MQLFVIIALVVQTLVASAAPQEGSVFTATKISHTMVTNSPYEMDVTSEVTWTQTDEVPQAQVTPV